MASRAVRVVGLFTDRMYAQWSGLRSNTVNGSFTLSRPDQLGHRPRADSRLEDAFPVLLHASARPSCLQLWAQRAGLTVSWSSGQRWVLVSGSPANIERNLNVSIDNYRPTEGPIIYSANKRPASPANVCGEVAGVGVIRSFERPKPMNSAGVWSPSPAASHRI